MLSSIERSQTFPSILPAFNLSCLLQTWNNIVAVHFKDEDCTTQWRQTFTQDFEGKYKKVCNAPFGNGSIFVFV